MDTKSAQNLVRPLVLRAAAAAVVRRINLLYVRPHLGTIMWKPRTQGQSIVQDFIATIQEQMQIQGLTISALADRADVGRPYLHRVLAGEQTPNLQWVEKVLRALGVTITFQKSA